jgi:KH/beta-lactamase-domain protein
MVNITSTILKEILKIVDEDNNRISDAGFEGANIVLYTDDKKFFVDDQGLIKKAVHTFKKRIELRPDPKLCIDEGEAEHIIRELIPDESEVDSVIFDKQRSIALVETEKPGVAIGKQGSILREIKEKTFWVPVVRRKPAIKAKLIDDIRGVLYQNNDFRRKFLDQTGHRVYDGWIRGKKSEWVRLTVLGGGRQVGRSAFLLQTPESRILLDCGMDPALDITNSDAFPYLESPDFKIDELDAVIVSHAHLDHSALVPLLVKYGYKGPIYCTEPTRDVMALLQLDMVKIMRGDGKEPLYTSEEVKEVVKQSITLGYEEVTDITPDIRITFYNSGHIIGGSMVHMHIGNGLHNFMYTGDIKYNRTALLEPAHLKFPRLETVLVESTYGGKENFQPTREECEKDMEDIIKNTIKNKGKVLVPVLGVGRAQEVMLVIERMVREKLIPEVPVYIDGMVWEVTAIHTAYPEFLNSNVRKQIFHKNENPFLAPFFKRVGSAKERKDIIENEGSCVILATSGMMVGGASVQYFRQLCDNPRNSLIFVCYQAEGSLGKKIQMGQKEINYYDGGTK